MSFWHFLESSRNKVIIVYLFYVIFIFFDSWVNFWVFFSTIFRLFSYIFAIDSVIFLVKFFKNSKLIHYVISAYCLLFIKSITLFSKYYSNMNIFIYSSSIFVCSYNSFSNYVMKKSMYMLGICINMCKYI
jgi:hypothetical protein